MNDAAAPRLSRRGGARGFMIFALAGMAFLVGLGTWQLDRLRWKEALIAERTEAFSLPPFRVSGVEDDVKAFAWRRVTVAGTFLHDKEVFVGPRARRGEPGWHVLIPLRLVSGKTVVVDRGWVPMDRKEPAQRPEGNGSGPVTIEGVVKRPGKLGRFAPQNEPSRGQWFHADPAALAAHWGLSDVAPWWVEAVTASDARTYPIGRTGLTLPSNNHLQYAITWYSLAVALGIIAIIQRRAARRTDAV